MTPREEEPEDVEDINISLAILKERMRVTHTDLTVLRSSTERIEQKIDGKLAAIETKIADLDAKFVTVEQFKPIQKIVFGAVALVVTAVIGALIALVIRGGPTP